MNDRVATFDQLINALIQQESSWNPEALSPKGFRGLMQLSPEDSMVSVRRGVPSIFDVADFMGLDVGDRTIEDSDRLLQNPHANMAVGVPYLRELMAKYNWDLPLALTSYNAGAGLLDDVLAAGGGIEDMPKEEQRTYARDVNEEFRNLYGFDLPPSGVLVSPRPQERPVGLLGGY